MGIVMVINAKSWSTQTPGCGAEKKRRKNSDYIRRHVFAIKYLMPTSPQF